MPGNAASVQYKTATILNGQTTSDEVDCDMSRPARLSMPAAFTGVSVTFSIPTTRDAATYQTLYNDDGTVYTVTLAAGREVVLDMTKFMGVQKFKIVSSGAEGADRSIGVVIVS